MEEIVEEITVLYEQHSHNIKLDMDFFGDFSQVEDRIFHKVINYEKNRELLKSMPYFRWHDLAVVFYYAMQGKAFGRASIPIHSSHLDMWGKTAEEIYHTARRNMKQKMPELLVPIQKLLDRMPGLRMEESSIPLYVLTNKEKIFGASAMLYSEKIKELAATVQIKREDLFRIYLCRIDCSYHLPVGIILPAIRHQQRLNETEDAGTFSAHTEAVG